MGYIADKILKLSRQLYPTGRAFRFFEFSNLEKLHKGLALSEERFYNAAVSIKDSLLPDNDNFTSDDATDWERRLGMITNPTTALSIRKGAIMRKLNQPGEAPAKINWRHLQSQLQLAGFDVYVYENRFGYYPYGEEYYTQTPDDVAGTVGYFFKTNRLGLYRLGQRNYGGVYSFGLIANHIDEDIDNQFVLKSSNLRYTFFIGGATLGSFANVDESRKEEFRQLILILKPVQNIGFLFINYT